MTKTGIFVDVQNIYYTTRQAYGRHFDYKRFWAQTTRDRELVTAIAYATDRGDSKQQRFQEILRNIGFEIKLRPYLQRSDGSAKADWDVGITLDVVESAPALDTIVLASGDGDFDLLALRCREKYQCEFEVYGVPGLTGAALIDAASLFQPITEDLLLPLPHEAK